jgi:protein CpxP
MNVPSTFTAAVTLVAAIVLTPLPGQAQMMPMPPGPPAPMMPHGPGEHPPMMVPELGLSDAQQDKVFAIMHAAQPQHRELVKGVDKAREALHAMTKTGEFDEKKAQSLSQSLAQSVAALELDQARTEAQVSAILTPEQRKLLASGRPHHPPHMN